MRVVGVRICLTPTAHSQSFVQSSIVWGLRAEQLVAMHM